MSMKYVVVKGADQSERLFVFPAQMDHSDFFGMLHRSYPGLELVSAGAFKNFHDTLSLEGGGSGEFDQVSLSGESYTLKTHSRPEDDELFRRLSNGY
jgi:hypothetical protein